MDCICFSYKRFVIFSQTLLDELLCWGLHLRWSPQPRVLPGHHQPQPGGGEPAGPAGGGGGGGAEPAHRDTERTRRQQWVGGKPAGGSVLNLGRFQVPRTENSSSVVWAGRPRSRSWRIILRNSEKSSQSTSNWTQSRAAQGALHSWFSRNLPLSAR